MLMYKLTEYSDFSPKQLEVYGNNIEMNHFQMVNSAVADFAADNNDNTSFKFKTNIAGRTGNYGTKNVKISVSLDYLCNFWRALEMSLINCDIDLALTQSPICFIIDAPIANQAKTFTITETKFYVPVVTLSTQESEKLLQQWKSDFKRTINRNKCEPKVTVEQRIRYFDFLI